MPDLTASAMQMRVSIGDTCLSTITDDRYEIDLNILDLPPRLYTGSIWIDWANGGAAQGQVLLNVIGGC